jgi:hypothetical protein
MDEAFTVVVVAPQADAVVAGALAGRAVEGRAELLVLDSQELLGLFEPGMRRRLPRGYSLVLCGQQVVHTDWDGRLVRPALMDALRGFVGPIRWFSSGVWESEDRRAVAHVVGEGNLTIADPGALAAAVCRACCAEDDEYASLLVRLAQGRGADEAEQRRADVLQLVLSALKAHREEMERAAAMLMAGGLQGVLDACGERAGRMAEQNRRFAVQHAEEPRPMGSMRLVCVSLPPPRQPFWAEVGRYARQEHEAELSLCHLGGRPVMVLAGEDGLRADLRTWARYVTDLLPGCRTVGAHAHVVPLVVSGLTRDEGLKDEVLRLLAEGAHLLRG